MAVFRMRILNGFASCLVTLACVISEARRYPINIRECGISAPVGRIINGSTISRIQVPWLVTIVRTFKDGGQYVCGGSIVSRNVILTAAHCFSRGGIAPRRLEVYYNTTRFQEGPVIEVKHGVIHQKYAGDDNEYDIGLMKLSRPLPKFDKFVRPVCLPRQNQKVKPAAMLMAGIGWTSFEGPLSRKYLYYMPRVLPDEDCRDALFFTHRVMVHKELRWICTRHPYKMAYAGDSGGPLTAHMKNGKSTQFGIAAFGSQKSNAGKTPVVFTRVPFFMKWIMKSLKKIKYWKKVIQ